MCGFGDNWLKENAPRDPEVESAAGRALLMIFVKNPRPGKVKTRLAKTIGPEKALEAYRMMLRHTRETALEAGCARAVFYSGEVEEDEWRPEQFAKYVQTGRDLGERMKNAFIQAFASGFDRVVIIGSDCLDLRAEHLEAAFRALGAHDFVVGPAVDGGYYLLGMRALYTRLFENKQWSTETVLQDTLADIRALGKSVFQLPRLSDIDYESDLEAARGRI